ncbi:MAG: DUF3887 domain-containing protein [Pyrinomonadaceae bacterium]|jgi:hypothetical protein|nr:DUF3887 domain-containing protein [Pyrinomonadaceae bacterium]
MKLNHKRNLSVILLIFVFIVLACSTLTKGKAEGEKAVEKFRQQLAVENYDEIYQNSSKKFKEEATEVEAKELFEAVNKKLGKIRNSNLQSWRSQATTYGSFTTLVYETEFELDKGIETFVLEMDGDEAKIAGYNVNSKAFLK